MFKRSSRPSKNSQLAVVAATIGALLTGAAVSALDMFGVVDFNHVYRQHIRPAVSGMYRPQTLALRQPSDSVVKSLINVPPAERAEQLEQIANDPDASDRHRARYLLASDLIQQGKAGSAIQWLEDLESDYSVLAPYVKLKRAQAYTAMGETDKAEAAWRELLRRHSQHPVAAEALYALGATDPQYWQQAIEEFPAYPKTVKIAQTLLKDSSDPLPLMRLIVKHGLYLPDIVPLMDRMVERYSSELQPEDWELIGFGYWETLEYRKAGAAYSRAPATPVNLYRAARGLQIGQQREAAIAAYRYLNETFPEAPETAEGLLKLASMLEPDNAILVLDQVRERFPDKAAEALYERSLLLDAMNSGQSAVQARQSILTQYSDSEAAARLRWAQATQYANQGDYQQAWEWARQIPAENRDSNIAPEAAFWVAKWSLRLNRPEEAQSVFEHIITHYPESYYAWRSAVNLGWDVGDFDSVRDYIPKFDLPARRTTLPAGSVTLLELYQLGQDWDAWALWQTEFENPMQPTIAEQFTDGLLRLGIGDHLDGIFMVSSLAWREQPEDQEQYEILAEQDAYWQALYPIPFLTLIQDWSQQRQLNPLLVTALIRQESRFEPKISSSVGAKGLMQVMPETAAWISGNTNIKSYNLDNPEDNIKLGTWYLDFTHQEYNNNSLFAVASYNAGPGNVAEWITRQNFKDADEFVSVIPFPETQDYVKSVFGGYWNYLRLYNPEVGQRVAQYTSRRQTTAFRAP